MHAAQDVAAEEGVEATRVLGERGWGRGGWEVVQGREAVEGVGLVVEGVGEGGGGRGFGGRG